MVEEGKILLVGNETDYLHCGFSSPLNENSKRYPSADHYAHSMILSQLGLDDIHILELLATPSGDVPKRARQLLRENMPAGHDMNSLAQYLMTSRQSYTMLGLRLRAEQDERFRQTLMETGDALLIVCDSKDSELGIGMNEDVFASFARRKHANAEMISQWMHDERIRPREVGQNQLGFFLMWLRYELREKERLKWLTANSLKSPGISSSDQDDKSVEISISDFVVSLQGIFQPLSNYFSMNLEIKGDTYRSVEHYAYQRLFEALRLSYNDVMKIRTTVKPVDVAKAARGVFKQSKVDETELEHKLGKLDRWRQSAMKHKVSKSDYLQKLLLATGNAILLETNTEGDPQWISGTDEFEVQHLLTKLYVSSKLLIDWMAGREKLPSSLSHFGGNKTGLLLMELREKFCSTSTHRIPLVAPLSTSVLRTAVSNHMVCFTPESVLHPFHMAELRISPEIDPVPSPIHFVVQVAIRFFKINKELAHWIMDSRDSLECWDRLHSAISEHFMPPVEKIKNWFMDERQKAIKASMRICFEQHPQLLRVLLDTGDSLLVSCARFSTTEAELNIGLRERDLRLLCFQVRLDTKQLMDISLRPIAFRPPYFGGNRLGLILMELRREFILKGIFPHHLPELPLPVDALLGSESPLENYVPNYNFQIFDTLNHHSIWANPFLLMVKKELIELLKKQKDSKTDLWANAKYDLWKNDHWPKANSRKRPPLLISRNGAMVEQVYALILESDQKTEDEEVNGQKVLDELPMEVIRAVYRRMVSALWAKAAKSEEIQQIVDVKLRDSNKVQDLRRMAERLRDKVLHDKSPANDLLPAWMQLNFPPPSSASSHQQLPLLPGPHPAPLSIVATGAGAQQHQQHSPSTAAAAAAIRNDRLAAALAAAAVSVSSSSSAALSATTHSVAGMLAAAPSGIALAGPAAIGGGSGGGLLSAPHPQHQHPNPATAFSLAKIPSLLSELSALGSSSSYSSHNQQQQQQFSADNIGCGHHNRPLSHHQHPHHHQQQQQLRYGGGGSAAGLNTSDYSSAAGNRPSSRDRRTGPRQHNNSGSVGEQHHYRRQQQQSGTQQQMQTSAYGGGGTGAKGRGGVSASQRRGDGQSSYRYSTTANTNNIRGQTAEKRSYNSNNNSNSSSKEQQHQQSVPPQPKKPKRIVDESELSEGEILSDEDED